MNLEKRQTLDVHWTYITLGTGQCTLGVPYTLYCTVYTGHTLEYIAVYTAVHWSVHWTYGGRALESQGQRSLGGCCLWGRTELDMTETT